MKKILLILGFILLANYVVANNTIVEPNVQAMEIETLKSQLKASNAANHALHDSINRLNNRVLAITDSISSFRMRMSSIEHDVEKNSEDLKQAIDSTNEKLVIAEEITHEGFKKHNFYLVGIVLAALLGSMLLYYFLRNRMKRGSATINDIKNVQKTIQEDFLKLDNKLISIIEKETTDSKANLDHSLVMKVADEVVRIEMNLSRMDKGIKGYKQLSKAIERIKNNFMAQGYEIVNLLGTTYNDGMRINADFVVDESLVEGSRIITSITKPQINYKGKMIQKGIVTVSQNI